MSRITKNQLTFDPTDSDNTDNVGAYVRSSDGTLITSTGTALDVYDSLTHDKLDDLILAIEDISVSSNFIDGGSATSIYTMDQYIDGGSASTF